MYYFINVLRLKVIFCITESVIVIIVFFLLIK